MPSGVFDSPHKRAVWGGVGIRQRRPSQQAGIPTSKWRRDEITNAESARRCNMAISTVYRKLWEAGISLDVPTD